MPHTRVHEQQMPVAAKPPSGKIHRFVVLITTIDYRNIYHRHMPAAEACVGRRPPQATLTL